MSNREDLAQIAAERDERDRAVTAFRGDPKLARAVKGQTPKPAQVTAPKAEHVLPPEGRRAVREAVGWSIPEVAQAVGAPVDSVAAWEAGATDPSTSLLASGYRAWLKSASDALWDGTDNGFESFPVSGR